MSDRRETCAARARFALHGTVPAVGDDELALFPCGQDRNPRRSGFFGYRTCLGWYPETLVDPVGDLLGDGGVCWCLRFEVGDYDTPS